uniref:Uncharacterized protein n=1 Tax=Aegilops tauschii TaxID=37682 RepID=M8CZW2_AEGTA
MAPPLAEQQQHEVRMEDGRSYRIAIADFPGGPGTFEATAKFCYGSCRAHALERRTAAVRDGLPGDEGGAHQGQPVRARRGLPPGSAQQRQRLPDPASGAACVDRPNQLRG